MAKKKNKKVIRYRKPLNINVGMIFFALIFAYMSFYVYTYLKRDKIEFYEVAEGSIVNDQRYNGIIFRTEKVKETSTAGNINYYLREGKKAAVGTRIYSIDETGTLSKLLAERKEGDTVLSKENLSSLKKQLSSFSQTFTEESFQTVYDTRYSLDSEVLEYVSTDTLKNLDSVIAEMGINFEQVRADESGIVSYAIDSMENVTPEQVNAEMFARTEYKKNIVKSGNLVGVGEPVYKLVTAEDWSIVFPLTEDKAALYNGKQSLLVKFPGKDLKTSAAYKAITGSDGNLYGKLDFDKYMEQFVSERFVDFEVITEEVSGLKIPRSAVTDAEFYLIPKEYFLTDQNGFLKETYSDGGPGAEVVSCTVYGSDDTYYYVDAGSDSSLKAGDYLVLQNTGERYQVGAKGTLQGVYNINRGYTVFRKIEILTSNDEYYTIKKGTDYGLSVYDHIVLDAKAVSENGVIIYQ